MQQQLLTTSFPPPSPPNPSSIHHTHHASPIAPSSQLAYNNNPASHHVLMSGGNTTNAVVQTKMRKFTTSFTASFIGITGYPNTMGSYSSSPTVELDNTLWSIRLYPGGIDESAKGFISCYLSCESTGVTRASYKISIINQMGWKNLYALSDGLRAFQAQSSDSLRNNQLRPCHLHGEDKFISWHDIRQSSNGHCVDDTIVIRVDLIVYGDLEQSVLTSPNPPLSNILESKSTKQKLGLRTLHDDLVSMLGDTSSADITIKVPQVTEEDLVSLEGSDLKDAKQQYGIVTAHKFVLCLRSTVFRTMFDSHMQESNSNTILITDFHIDVVREMLYFLYTDSCHMELLPDLSHNLLAIACKYHIEGLKQICEHYLCSILSVSNALELLELSDMYEAKLLKAKALMFVANNLKTLVLFHAHNGSLITPDNNHRQHATSPTPPPSHNAVFELLGFELCQDIMLYMTGLHPLQQKEEMPQPEPSHPRTRRQSYDAAAEENHVAEV